METVGYTFRKLIHIGNAFFPILYLYFIPDRWVLGGLLALLWLIAVWVESHRQSHTWLRSVFQGMLVTLLKPEEREGRWTGATWVFAGSALTILLFPKEIACLSLLFMSFGDTAAGIVGRRWGRISIGNKTLEGSLGGIAVCLLVAWFFPSLSWAVKGTGALTAMILEALPLAIDDNLRLPLGAGLVMTLLGLAI
ncbi:MAG: hypothetical protein D6762_06600 [Candidatus Neomarinimicrobiota bacterium]|nr:MAG: hypothetical protein D6762_06600 [Candidatus Neomarinimicrobiota bacterium]